MLPPMRSVLGAADQIGAWALYLVFAVILAAIAAGFAGSAWLLITHGLWWAALIVLIPAAFGVYCWLATRE